MRKHVNNGRHNEKGQEVLDNTPLAVPLKYKRPKTDFTRFAEQMRAASRLAAMSGMETEEEANDFHIEDDDFPMPDAPWEEHFHGQFEEDARIAKQGLPRRREKQKKVTEEPPAPQAQPKAPEEPREE